MRRLCPWKPHVKKGSVEDRHRLKIPQFAGSPGWLLLTHNEHGDPVALFVDKQDRIEVLYLVMDERLFSDSVLRVVRLGPWQYVVYDLAVFNGQPYTETRTYSERQTKLRELLEAFHFPDLIALRLPEDVPEWDTPVRGYEYYDDAPGTLGVFCPGTE